MNEEHSLFLLDWRAIQGSKGERSVGFKMPNGAVVIRHNGNISNSVATEAQARAMFPKMTMIECPWRVRLDKIKLAAYYLSQSDDHGELENWLRAENYEK